MKDYLTQIFTDIMLSYLTKKYGTKLTDNERLNKCMQEFDSLRINSSFTITSTQAIFDKKGLSECYSDTLNGQPVYKIMKLGLFGKVKICYYITRIKDQITSEYLDKIFEELRQQASGENVFNAPDYKNA